MTRLVRVALFVLAACVAGVAAAQPVADRVPITFDVEHVHNTGSCKGQLTVDKWLFTYRSAERPQDDRDWKLTELKSAESNKPNELTLRTRESVRGLGLDKNYKFKVPGGMDRAVLDYMKDRID
jgi:hypothetical protein